jgi:regulator of RNase E activity RraA
MNTQTLEKLRAIDTATVANAIAKIGVRPKTQGYAGPEIRCLFPEQGVLLGYAVTARFGTREVDETNFRDHWVAFTQTLEEAPMPAICVFEDCTAWPMQGALIGEVMATIMQNLGAVGCVTNGAVRDVEQMRAIGFGCFAAGVMAYCGQLKFLESQVPVRLGRLEINPGDLVHADANGVVVIPSAIADEIPEAARQVLQLEAKIMATARTPGFRAQDIATV